MGVTIGTPARKPGDRLPLINEPVIYVKEEFGDGWTFEEQSAQFGARFGKDWTLAPELQFIMCSINAQGQDLDRAEFQRPYGPKQVEPYDNRGEYKQRLPEDLTGWWVVIMFGEYLDETQRRGTQRPHWIGRIYDAPQAVYDPTYPLEEDKEGGGAGMQRWVAYGPRQLLRLVQMSTALWYNPFFPATLNKLEWVPTMNGRDKYTMLVGNRSINKPTGSPVYAFSGDAPRVWNHYDFAEYVLYHFMGENWYLGGQANILQGMESVIDFGQTSTVEQVLRKLIPIEAGLDFFIRWRNAGAEPGQTWNAGWEVVVFALHADPVSFGATTLPGNVNKYELKLKDTPEVERCQIVPSNDHLYKRVIILGRRAIVCCTVQFASGALERAWTASAELNYKNPPVSQPTDPDQNDAYRRLDRLRDVFRKFKLDWGWDKNNGTASPVIGYNGQVVPGAVADWQEDIRKTLSWLPLDENTDYSVWPPIYNGPANTTPDQMAPAVWIEDIANGGWYLLDSLQPGIGLSVLPNEWGCYIQANPNHLIAFNNWAGAAPSRTNPVYAYNSIYFTFAFEHDQRAKLVFETPKSTVQDDTKILTIPDAEFWYMAPNTVFGTNAAGQPLTNGSTGRVLRNDIEKLERAMAGAIVRYTQQRWRAEIQLAGLYPWDQLLGQILVVDDGFGNVKQLGGPVTSIQWLAGARRPATVVKAGYAL